MIARVARTAIPSGRNLQQLVLGLFIASGAAGLIYQVVWSRELVLLFGNTSQAISTIVTAFLFGLGTGAYAGGRLATGHRNPLRLYGMIEFAVAALAIFLPSLFPSLGVVYQNAYTDASPQALALIRFGLAFAAVTPATFAMGMTLPALTSYMVRSLDVAAPRLSELYAANTLGAVAGTLIAGFALIELFGLSTTALIAVGMNFTAGLVALIAATRTNDLPIEPPQRASEARLGAARNVNLIYAATFISGFSSLAFEVLWTRLFAEGSGSNIYLFAAILAIFLFGIAAGSVFYGYRSRHARDTLSALGVCLAVIGLGACATVVLGSGPLGDGYYTVRPLIILPATFAMGYAFPLSVRLVMPSAAAASSVVGKLYAANTAGSVLGSFTAIFVLASTLGTNTSVIWLGALDLLVAAALVMAGRPALRNWKVRWAGPMAATAVVALIAPGAGLPIARSATENHLRQEGVFVAHREDNIATVDVEGGMPAQRRLFVTGVAMTFLTVDTKLMAYLPKVLRPEASELLDICFGMGSTYRSSLILGLHTDAVELSPSVPGEMAAFFTDADQVLKDNRGRIYIADGRNYIRVSSQRYDVIVVDPPPPIESAGTVVLYTSEFFKDARAHLNEGGIFLLWVPYLLTLEEFKMHLRTFRSAFPHVKVVLGPGGHGAYLLGSEAPMSFDAGLLSAVLGSPSAAADFATAPDDPRLNAAQWAAMIQSNDLMNDSQVDTFVGAGPMITDDHPLSEYFLIRVLASHDHTGINNDRLRSLRPR